MANSEREMPAQTRSPFEIKFVLRNAGRKTGPAVLRDLARNQADSAEALEAKPAAAAPQRTKTLY